MEPTVFPRDHLRACILLVLAEGPAHGYDLPALLEPLGLGASDRGFVYRTLRTMDAEGLVFSAWDASPVGPARRMYRVTPAGERWVVSGVPGVREADAVMATWLARYERVVAGVVPVVAGVPAAS